MEKLNHVEHAPCGLVKVSRRFGGTCLSLQVRRVDQVGKEKVPQKTEAMCSDENISFSKS
jgi:hypothetical protein